MEAIDFYDPKGAYGCFSNYWTIPGGFQYNGIRYQTSEHAFQAAKFNYDGASIESMQYAEIIRKANTPNKARILARQSIGGGYKWRTDLNPIILRYQHIGIRSNWREIRDQIMFDILKQKFDHEHCRTMLLTTGSMLIRENSPRDTYWGIGKDKTGQNKLGLLLMQIRDNLRS
jgi:hypothetical protein